MRFRRFGLAFLLAGLMGIFQIGRTAYAAPEWETVSAGSAEWALHAVADDAAMGLLDRDTAAIYRAYALFAPSKLPSRYQPTPNADTDVESGHASCWTAALNELRVAYAELTPYAREEIDRVAPSYIGLATHYRGGFAAPTLPDDSAILARDNFGDTGGLKVPHVHYTDHFAIRWGSSFEFADTSITVEDLGEYLEDAWDLFVNDQGYARPYQSNDYYLDVYVGNSGSGSPGIGGGAAAYVTFYDVSSRDIFDSMNYMVIQKGVFSYGDYTREVVGHEFYHMIQFGAGIAHDCYDYMYTAASEGSAWAAEASAVWAEDEASPDSNFWVGFVSEAQNYPELSIMYFGGSLHYGRSLFFDYIDERHGGEEAIYALWNECHASILDSADALLRDQGTSLHAMFPKYALANFFGDYLEGDLFPTAPLHTQFDDYPLEFIAGEDLGDDVPENFAANYLRFAPDSGNQLSFHFEGADRVGGRDVTWGIGVVKVDAVGDYDVEYYQAPADTKALDDGDKVQADFSVVGVGTKYDKIYLVLTPMTDQRSISSPSFNYSLDVTQETVEEPEDEDDGGDFTGFGDDDEAEGDDDGDDDDDDGGAGCGA